ncbi:MAG: ATP synthase F1 subunit epsilon [Actinomycetota bacterium]|nr:ATP synthase F1 subunit epsilon [Actinomycetota bacterium]
MAHKTFPVEVLTPEGRVFEGEVEMLSTRTPTGSIGIRANHAPLMAILDPTELRLYEGENEVRSFAQGEGYLQVVNNTALVLVDEVLEPDSMNRSDIESRLREAEQGLESAEEDSEEYRRCERNVRRYKAFLEVGEG